MKIQIKHFNTTYNVEFDEGDVPILARSCISDCTNHFDGIMRRIFPEEMHGRQIRFTSAQETRINERPSLSHGYEANSTRWVNASMGCISTDFNTSSITGGEESAST